MHYYKSLRHPSNNALRDAASSGPSSFSKLWCTLLSEGGCHGAVLARSVGKEQEEEERQQLHKSWEMAAVLDFLDLFREDLKLDRAFTAHELESVLILSPGGEGLLGSVHTVGLLPLADCGLNIYLERAQCEKQGSRLPRRQLRKHSLLAGEHHPSPPHFC